MGSPGLVPAAPRFPDVWDPRAEGSTAGGGLTRAEDENPLAQPAGAQPSTGF